jgi:hypothetical protein
MIQGRCALDSAKLNILEALHLQLDELVLLLQLLLQLRDQLLVCVQFALFVTAQHCAICKLLLQVAALAGRRFRQRSNICGGCAHLCSDSPRSFRFSISPDFSLKLARSICSFCVFSSRRMAWPLIFGASCASSSSLF